MGTELVKASTAAVATAGNAASLPELVERAGGAARFAWEEFFYAEHHNRHTQRAYERAVRRFLGWAEGQGVELAAITPGMVGQYLVGLGGSPAKRNQHPAALRGFFDGHTKYARYYGVGGGKPSSGLWGRDPVQKLFDVDSDFDDQDHEWYDHGSDPLELVNLANDRARRAELRGLFERLLAYEEQEMVPAP